MSRIGLVDERGTLTWAELRRRYDLRSLRFVTATDTSPDQLRQHARYHLAGYKVPRSVTVLDELLRNDTGKVVKRDLVPRIHP